MAAAAALHCNEGGKAAGAREELRVREREKTFRGIQRKIAGARE